MPVSEVAEGMVLTGYSVVKGTEPKLQNRFANNELAAMLHLGTKTRIDLEVFDKVVSRGKYISVFLPGSEGTPYAPE